jgi:GAF domain-containing protein
VAVALQNARSYEQTQTRARHEQILRQITARVRGSTNPDAIVRAAVRELGTALDRPTFVRLGKTDQLRQPKTEREAPLVPTDSPGGNGQETGRPEGDK